MDRIRARRACWQSPVKEERQLKSNVLLGRKTVYSETRSIVLEIRLASIGATLPSCSIFFPVSVVRPCRRPLRVKWHSPRTVAACEARHSPLRRASPLRPHKHSTDGGVGRHAGRGCTLYIIMIISEQTRRSPRRAVVACLSTSECNRRPRRSRSN